jgi:LmbE family N-acetylglucosaminyl deacetylase
VRPSRKVFPPTLHQSGCSVLGLIALLGCFCSPSSAASELQLEKLTQKTILIFTPHPDDDTFCCAGTLALLAKNGNNIRIVIYTNDDKGSYDPSMTSERLAAIRMKEEEAACKIIGISAESIHWLPYHDGMLEYANPQNLVEQVTGIIRQIRPDVVLSVDPGSEYVRWHKTDHRMAANNTIDAVRAAEWHLYFPNQFIHDHLRPWKVPYEAYFYTTERDANYWVNIDTVIEKKLAAAMAHVSQWEPSIREYRPDWDPAVLARLKADLLGRAPKKDGHFVEAFRITSGFNNE